MLGKLFSRKSLKNLGDLTFRRHHSKIHEQIWQDYEKILMYRSMVSQFSRILLLAFQTAVS